MGGGVRWRRGSEMSTSPEILLSRKFRFWPDFQISLDYFIFFVGIKDRGAGRCVIEVVLSSGGHHNHHNCRQLLLQLIPRRCRLISQTKP